MQIYFVRWFTLNAAEIMHQRVNNLVEYTMFEYTHGSLSSQEHIRTGS